MMQSHKCPRCGCNGITRDSYGQTQCILCGFSDSTGTGTDDADSDPETLLALYARSQLIMASRDGGKRLVTIW
jgi:ribosomal protein L37AE/L43A